MKKVQTLAEWEKSCGNVIEFETHNCTVIIELDRIPEPVQFALKTAIELIKKYCLPCDLTIRELPGGVLAQHARYKRHNCEIVLSTNLAFEGDHRAIHRRILHEIAHHLAGPGHGHDETFKRIAADLYAREGYPRGKRGDFYGNM
jgi:SprT-like family protein